MNKLYLMKNKKLFQGEKYLKKNKNYFEGWYFKSNNGVDSISFIPGISIDEKGKRAFIQVITNDISCFINYDINSFEFSHEPFYIKIGNSVFKEDSLHIDIKNEEEFVAYGDIKYSDTKNINCSIVSPNIMGIFSYVPFMECNHAILSMKSITNGKININDKEIVFIDDVSYIEKDFGISFPKKYIWVQANNFNCKEALFMMSIANIPFKILEFTGIICSLIIDDKEYRFATYNNTKLVKCDIKKSYVNVILKKGSYYLNMEASYNEGKKLIAPTKGKMDKDIIESIEAIVYVTLKKKDKIIFSDVSKFGGLEIVL